MNVERGEAVLRLGLPRVIGALCTAVQVPRGILARRTPKARAAAHYSDYCACPRFVN
jgi:hypothetical protein